MEVQNVELQEAAGRIGQELSLFRQVVIIQNAPFGPFQIIILATLQRPEEGHQTKRAKKQCDGYQVYEDVHFLTQLLLFPAVGVMLPTRCVAPLSKTQPKRIRGHRQRRCRHGNRRHQRCDKACHSNWHCNDVVDR